MRSGPRRALAVGIALALALSACGGDDDDESATTTTEPEAPADDDGPGADDEAVAAASVWARDVCASLISWQDDLEGLTQVVQNPDPAIAGDLEGLKGLLVDFLTEASDRTDEMVGEVQEAGAPDIDQGEDIAADFSGALQAVGDEFASFESQVADIPTDDPTTFQSELRTVLTSFQETSEGFGEQFEALGDDDGDASDPLDEAFDNEQACAAL